MMGILGLLISAYLSVLVILEILVGVFLVIELMMMMIWGMTVMMVI